jgi:hypothetical protein
VQLVFTAQPEQGEQLNVKLSLPVTAVVKGATPAHDGVAELFDTMHLRNPVGTVAHTEAVLPAGTSQYVCGVGLISILGFAVVAPFVQVPPDPVSGVAEPPSERPVPWLMHWPAVAEPVKKVTLHAGFP